MWVKLDVYGDLSSMKGDADRRGVRQQQRAVPSAGALATRWRRWCRAVHDRLPQFARPGCSSRATMSDEPPGAKVTMILMGFAARPVHGCW